MVEGYNLLRERLSEVSRNLDNISDYSPATREQVLQEVSATAREVGDLYLVRILFNPLEVA